MGVNIVMDSIFLGNFSLDKVISNKKCNLYKDVFRILFIIVKIVEFLWINKS